MSCFLGDTHNTYIIIVNTSVSLFQSVRENKLTAVFDHLTLMAFSELGKGML